MLAWNGLWCCQPIEAWVQGPTAPLLIQIPADAPGEATEDDPSACSPAPTLEIQTRLPAFAPTVAVIQGVTSGQKLSPL